MRSVRLLLVLIGVCGLFGSARVGAEPEFSEYTVKAAFLYNFAKFVDWPVSPEKAGSTDSLFTIGVFGKTPITDELAKSTEGKLIHGKSVKVGIRDSIEELRQCDVVFFGKLPEARRRAALDSLDRHAVLTVGESDAFLDEGGMIRFIMVDDMVRFEIAASTAARAGLLVSSRLMRLATNSSQSE